MCPLPLSNNPSGDRIFPPTPVDLDEVEGVRCSIISMVPVLVGSLFEFSHLIKHGIDPITFRIPSISIKNVLALGLTSEPCRWE